MILRLRVVKFSVMNTLLGLFLSFCWSIFLINMKYYLLAIVFKNLFKISYYFQLYQFIISIRRFLLLIDRLQQAEFMPLVLPG